MVLPTGSKAYGKGRTVSVHSLSCLSCLPSGRDYKFPPSRGILEFRRYVDIDKVGRGRLVLCKHLRDLPVENGHIQQVFGTHLDRSPTDWLLGC